jgi:hypothetical protein|tara:strand:+ start:69 stop:743 length:675 start_codon:yes stop_codon:yes gene_type:complete
MATFSFDSEARTPWNNQIFPGNYVSQLNAYRDQGVVAIPGAVFFRGVGALVLDPDTQGVVGDDGVLAAGTYDLKILSPDLRQDDKPRKDRAFVIPAGAVVYRTSVSAPGVREETVGDGVSITPAGITTPTAVGADAEADGYFNPVGEFSAFVSILDGSGLGSDTAVQVTVAGGGVISSQKPSAGACRKSPSAILVEVCYFLPDAAPSADDVNIPYSVEAGSSGN